MLYHILPDTSRSNYDPRKNIGPHADGIVGSTAVKSTDSVTCHLKELSLNQFFEGPCSSMSSNITHSIDVHSVQSSTGPNGNQQLGGNKKKGCNNNRKGGKNNNKPKDNGNNEKKNNHIGEGKKERCKVKFPCKLCTDDHLTHLFPKLVEAVRLLSLLPIVLTNPFSHKQHMASCSSNVRNVVGGIQNPSTKDSNCLYINMVNSHVNVATWSHDYSSLQTLPGLESPPPPEMLLQIKKLDPPPHILKGVLKHSTHNTNDRDAHNYSIVEDLGQTPCAMSSLKVLHMCPSQTNDLISKFDVTDIKHHFPYHVAFQIHVGYSKYTIKHAIVDQGTTTCVMSLIYWKAPGSLNLSQ
jgi:hypothetical protein